MNHMKSSVSESHDFDIYSILDRLNKMYEDHAHGDDYSSDILTIVSRLVAAEPPSDDDIDQYLRELDADIDEQTIQNENRSYVLRTAEEHVNGKRNVEYGDPISDFRTTAELWETYLLRTIEHRGVLGIKPHDVAAMMMLLKVSRISWSPEVEDHWIDAAGYAACGYDCTQRQ
jgi:hypothetical protein